MPGKVAKAAKAVTQRIEQKRIADLKPAPWNPRRITPAAIAGLSASLDRFGYVEPVIWNERSGYLVGGHQRVKALKAQGVRDLPVVIVDLSEADEKALNVALNNPHTSGEFDDTLAALLEEIRAADEIAFRALRLDLLVDGALEGRAGGNGDPEAVPDVPAEPKTRLGDLYEMGAHRLLCGDSTDEGAWRLLNIGPSAAVVTSPPYGVGGSAKLRDHYVRGNRQRKSFYANDADEISGWRNLMAGWTPHAIACADVTFVNLQMLAANKRDVISWFADNSDHFVDLIIWDKGNGAPQMQANVLNNAFEIVVVLAREKFPSRSIPLSAFHGTQSNVMRVPVSSQGHNGVTDHAAAFPVGFPEVIIRDIAGEAQVVVDPFAGTGSTMIAAEIIGRRCCAIEIDPGYCDVIVKRWEDFTGKKAVLHRA